MAKKKLPGYWTSVTPFSKVVALLLFIFLPILTFFLGVSYGQLLEKVQNETQGTYLVQPTPTQHMYLQGATPAEHMMGY